MKTSKALKKTLIQLEKMRAKQPGCQVYVCVAATQSLTTLAAEKVRTVIRERIHPYARFDSWLFSVCTNSYQIRCQMADDAFNNKLNATRVAWLESMIAEFKAKGD